MNKEKKFYQEFCKQMHLTQVFSEKTRQPSSRTIDSLKKDLTNIIQEWHALPKEEDPYSQKYSFIRNHQYHFSEDIKMRAEQENLLDSILLFAKYDIQKHRQSR